MKRRDLCSHRDYGTKTIIYLQIFLLMRYPHNSRSSSRSENSSFLKWILVVLGIIGAIFLVGKILGWSSNTENSVGLAVSGSGTIVISDKNGDKRDVEWADILSLSDNMLAVLSGTAHLTESGADIWVDKWGEVANRSIDSSRLSFEVINWRSWIEVDKDIAVKMKHIELTIGANDVILIEQQRVYSIVYVLRWDASIIASAGRTYTLTAGSRIMVSQSNLVNPGTSLASLAGVIDDSIQQNPFFIAHDGQALLKANQVITSTGNISTGSVFSGSSLGLTGTSPKYISISSPLDGSIMTWSSIRIDGIILDTRVRRITINDKEASLTNNSFSLQWLSLQSDTIDIVYKAYDAWSNILERGVITLYSQNKKQWTDRLIPTTFPTSDKVFRIINPLENPYKTTLSNITVSGVVPKNSVEYITVNNFRLKKYIPNSLNWYYYANTAYGTMKEGFNLYEIKFFGSDDTLLSTQLFTIIKEWGTTLSGE